MVCRFVGLQKADEVRIGAFKVINSGRRDEFVLQAPGGRFVPVDNEEVGRDDCVRCDACIFGDDVFQQPRISGLSGNGKQFLLNVELVSLVGRPVEVDAERGNHEQVFFDIDETGDQSAAFGYNDPAGNGEGPVKPGRNQHTAVFFHIQTDIGLVRHLGVCLDLECRGIAVGCGRLNLLQFSLRCGKSDDGRPVLGQEIFSTGNDFPFFCRVQLLKTGSGQLLCDFTHRLVGSGALFQKFKKSFVHFLLHSRGSGTTTLTALPPGICGGKRVPVPLSSSAGAAGRSYQQWYLTLHIYRINIPFSGKYIRNAYNAYNNRFLLKTYRYSAMSGFPSER